MGGRLRALASDLQLPKLFKEKHWNFFSQLRKAAITDSGKGVKRTSVATNQILRFKSVCICLLTFFFGLLSDPWEVSLFPLFQVCEAGELVLVSWGIFSFCSSLFSLSPLTAEQNPEK